MPFPMCDCPAVILIPYASRAPPLKDEWNAEMLRKRKQGSLGRDLLLGFEPVELFVDSLQTRFGDVATICADFQGGALIGIKWRAAVSSRPI